MVPDYYRSSEHFEDPEGYLKDISVDEAQSGDIVGLSRSHKTDPKKIHLTVVKHTINGSIGLIHASQESNTVEETLLQNITERKRHETVRFIKRPTVVYERPNTTALRKLKFLS